MISIPINIHITSEGVDRKYSIGNRIFVTIHGDAPEILEELVSGIEMVLGRNIVEIVSLEDTVKIFNGSTDFMFDINVRENTVYLNIIEFRSLVKRILSVTYEVMYDSPMPDHYIRELEGGGSFLISDGKLFRYETVRLASNIEVLYPCEVENECDVTEIFEKYKDEIVFFNALNGIVKGSGFMRIDTRRSNVSIEAINGVISCSILKKITHQKTDVFSFISFRIDNYNEVRSDIMRTIELLTTFGISLPDIDEVIRTIEPLKKLFLPQVFENATLSIRSENEKVFVSLNVDERLTIEMVQISKLRTVVNKVEEFWKTDNPTSMNVIDNTILIKKDGKHIITTLSRNSEHPTNYDEIIDVIKRHISGKEGFNVARMHKDTLTLTLDNKVVVFRVKDNAPEESIKTALKFVEFFPEEIIMNRDSITVIFKNFTIIVKDDVIIENIDIQSLFEVQEIDAIISEIRRVTGKKVLCMGTEFQSIEDVIGNYYQTFA